MKKQIEIKYSRSLKINKGNYEQDAPTWEATLLLDLQGLGKDEALDYERAEFQALKSRIDEQADFEWTKTALSDLRIREKDGKKYPSVTSITNPEPYTGDPEYGLRGTEIHRICNQFIETGIWVEPITKLTKLSYDDLKYKEFFENHSDMLDFENHEKNIPVFNDRFLYSGEIDLICYVEGYWTLVDIKTGAWSWPQLVAYGRALEEPVEQYAVFDLKKCELKTLTIDESLRYWESFLVKRGEFKSRFGV